MKKIMIRIREIDIFDFILVAIGFACVVFVGQWLEILAMVVHAFAFHLFMKRGV